MNATTREEIAYNLASSIIDLEAVGITPERILTIYSTCLLATQGMSVESLIERIKKPQ